MRGRTGRIVSTAIVLASVSLTACSSASAPPEPADQAPAAVPGPASAPAHQPVNRDETAVAGFLDRVNQYVALHQKLETTLPALSNASTPEQIDKHQRALAAMIQGARKDARPGDLFTPESQAVFRQLLAKVFGGPDGAALKASIMDENPVIPLFNVNDRYPDTVPVSTIPPQVLEGLPRLPEEMEFRFVGNDMILMDTHAHLIADFVKEAFP